MTNHKVEEREITKGAVTDDKLDVQPGAETTEEQAKIDKNRISRKNKYKRSDEAAKKVIRK